MSRPSLGAAPQRSPARINGRGFLLVPTLLFLAGWAALARAEPSAVVSRYVILGPDGALYARAIVAANDCPALEVDGARVSMRPRSPPGVAALRKTAAHPSKPSTFAVTACEARLPATTQAALLAGSPLPLPKAVVRRIVVLGDTGCRIKAPAEVQDCDKSWPFPQVALRAAAEKPDLVIHVGDYHYRETPCPTGLSGCQSSPWGYGWDTWWKDFFEPAAGLLAAAPWVVVRGNHEECARAGQGWFRYLAPETFAPERSCDDATLDGSANFSTPYLVSLGLGSRLLVFDSAIAGNEPLDVTKPDQAAILENYARELRDADGLAGATAARETFFLSHHPVLGFSPQSTLSMTTSNPALLAALGSVHGTNYFAPWTTLALHGHVHLFEAIDFASDHPATIVAGNGGDDLSDPLPPTIPAGTRFPASVAVKRFTDSHGFGYLVMDRTPVGWRISAKRVDGSVLTTCELEGRHLTCATDGPVQ